jgi:hypothetical protein
MGEEYSMRMGNEKYVKKTVAGQPVRKRLRANPTRSREDNTVIGSG